jgi:hypothetical protein
MKMMVAHLRMIKDRVREEDQIEFCTRTCVRVGVRVGLAATGQREDQRGTTRTPARTRCPAPAYGGGCTFCATLYAKLSRSPLSGRPPTVRNHNHIRPTTVERGTEISVSKNKHNQMKFLIAQVPSLQARLQAFRLQIPFLQIHPT